VTAEPTQEDFAAFAQHVAHLQEQYGVELTDEGAEDLIAKVVANGFTADATEEAFAGIAAEAGVEPPDSGEEYDTMDDYTAGDYEPPPPPDRVTAVNAIVEKELDRLKTKLGRSFTEREMEAIHERLLDTAMRHDHLGTEANFDAEAALNAHYEERGERAPDQWKRQDWVQYGVERMEEAERAEKADEEPRDLDLDKHADRVEYMAGRLEGKEYVDVIESDDGE
jgi:hypothetical protein